MQILLEIFYRKIKTQRKRHLIHHEQNSTTLIRERMLLTRANTVGFIGVGGVVCIKEESQLAKRLYILIPFDNLT